MSSTLDSIVTGSAVGAFLPPLTAIVQQPKWSANTKRVVAVLASLLGSVGALAATGGLDQFRHVPVVGTVLAVLAASQTTYDLIWKPSTIGPLVEAATSRSSSTSG